MRESEATSASAAFRKIMVASDTSKRASTILQMAAKLSAALGSEVLVVTVSTVPTGVEGNEADGIPANNQERETMDSLRRIVDDAFGGRSEVLDVKILHGDPAQRIIEYSAYSGSDLIIIGSRGQGPIRRAVGGSVSSEVVSKSERPVLVVK